MSNFDKFKIKKYKHWTVFLHENQCYLGWLVIWCDRAEAEDLVDATPEEYAELLVIIKEMRPVLKDLFQADWFNYNLLGNGFRHLHCHLIPRYASERIFDGVKFTDERWGHNYKTNHDFKISEETTRKIIKVITEKLPS